MKPYKYLFLSSSTGDTSIYSIGFTPCENAYGKSGGKRFALFFSKKDSRWNPKARGKAAVRVYDDGNGLDVSIPDGPSFRLDYAQAQELRIALVEIEKHECPYTTTVRSLRAKR